MDITADISDIRNYIRNGQFQAAELMLECLRLMLIARGYTV